MNRRTTIPALAACLLINASWVKIEARETGLHRYEATGVMSKDTITIDFDEQSVRVSSKVFSWVAVAHAPDWTGCVFNTRTKEKYVSKNVSPAFAGEPPPLLVPPLKITKVKEIGLPATQIEVEQKTEKRGGLSNLYFQERSLDSPIARVDRWRYIVWDEPVNKGVVDFVQHILRLPTHKGFPLMFLGYSAIDGRSYTRFRTTSITALKSAFDTKEPTGYKTIPGMRPIMVGRNTQFIEDMGAMYIDHAEENRK